jgi:hypothetical protein
MMAYLDSGPSIPLAVPAGVLRDDCVRICARRDRAYGLVPEILIRPATIADAYALARSLRAGDRASIASVGMDPRVVLRTTFRHSLAPPKAAFVDDMIAAMWGMGGNILSETAEVWLFAAPAIERVPFTFEQVAGAEIAGILAIKRRLETYGAADYAKAIRLFETLGFHIDPPVAMGPRRALFRRCWIERMS